MILCEYLLLSASYCAQCRYSSFLKSDPTATTSEHVPCKACIINELDNQPLNGHNTPLMFEPLQARDIGLKYE